MDKKALGFFLVCGAILGLYLYRINRPETQFSFPIPDPNGISLSSEESLVGAASIDITPPPKGSSGYSSGGFDIEGFRTRLKGRAFYLKPQEGPPLMLLQVDLQSASSLMHHKISKQVQEITGVPPSSLVISGTHSHGGPGNFYGSNFYNDWAGTQSKLDMGLFNFLTDRLTHLAEMAYKNRRPGTVTVGEARITDLTRNRSMGAYLANRNISPKNVKTAINPKLKLLRFDVIDGDSFKPIGAYASFSIHGTTVRPKKVYHADLFHYPSTILTKRLKAKVPERPSQEPIFAVVNGTHGDNSPSWNKQGFAESKRIGSLLADHIWTLFESLEPQHHHIKTRASTIEVDMLQEARQGSSDLCLPRIGMPMIGGAEDYKTPILSDLPGVVEGSPLRGESKCQGAKRILASFLQGLALAPSDFPRLAMVQLVTINQHAFLALPFEVTNESGRRMSQILETIYEDATVISCSNGYLGYLTTSEEFNEQHYEGAHNLYGPKTAAYVRSIVKQVLTNSKENRLSQQFQTWKFNLRVRHSSEISLNRPTHSIQALSQPKMRNKNGASYLFVHWRHAVSKDMAFHKPLVEVQTKHHNRQWQTFRTDENDTLEVIHLDHNEYEARLYDITSMEDGQLRFVIKGPQGEELYIPHDKSTGLKDAT